MELINKNLLKSFYISAIRCQLDFSTSTLCSVIPLNSVNFKYSSSTRNMRVLVQIEFISNCRGASDSSTIYYLDLKSILVFFHIVTGHLTKRSVDRSLANCFSINSSESNNSTASRYNRLECVNWVMIRMILNLQNVLSELF